MTFKCRKCAIDKEITEYPKAPNKQGHKATCRECYNAYYREYYKARPWQYNKHKGYVKKNDKIYKRQVFRHGLTMERHSEMLSLYDGKCHACKIEDAMVIDHDHACCNYGPRSCGHCVRGLLCNNCNAALGMTFDDVGRLQSLIEYLMAWQQKAVDS